MHSVRGLRKLPRSAVHSNPQRDVAARRAYKVKPEILRLPPANGSTTADEYRRRERSVRLTLASSTVSICALFVLLRAASTAAIESRTRAAASVNNRISNPKHAEARTPGRRHASRLVVNPPHALSTELHLTHRSWETASSFRESMYADGVAVQSSASTQPCECEPTASGESYVYGPLPLTSPSDTAHERAHKLNPAASLKTERAMFRQGPSPAVRGCFTDGTSGRTSTGSDAQSSSSHVAAAGVNGDTVAIAVTNVAVGASIGAKSSTSCAHRHFSLPKSTSWNGCNPALLCFSSSNADGVQERLQTKLRLLRHRRSPKGSTIEQQPHSIRRRPKHHRYGSPSSARTPPSLIFKTLRAQRRIFTSRQLRRSGVVNSPEPVKFARKTSGRWINAPCIPSSTEGEGTLAAALSSVPRNYPEAGTGSTAAAALHQRVGEKNGSAGPAVGASTAVAAPGHAPTRELAGFFGRWLNQGLIRREKSSEGSPPPLAAPSAGVESAESADVRERERPDSPSTTVQQLVTERRRTGKEFGAYHGVYPSETQQGGSSSDGAPEHCTRSHSAPPAVTGKEEQDKNPFSGFDPSPAPSEYDNVESPGTKFSMADSQSETAESQRLGGHGTFQHGDVLFEEETPSGRGGGPPVPTMDEGVVSTPVSLAPREAPKSATAEHSNAGTSVSEALRPRSDDHGEPVQPLVYLAHGESNEPSTTQVVMRRSEAKRLWNSESEAHSIPPWFSMLCHGRCRLDALGNVVHAGHHAGGRVNTYVDQRASTPPGRLARKPRSKSRHSLGAMVLKREQLRRTASDGLHRLPFAECLFCVGGPHTTSSDPHSGSPQLRRDAARFTSVRQELGEAEMSAAEIRTNTTNRGSDISSGSGVSHLPSCTSRRRGSAASSDSLPREPRVSVWGPRPRQMLFNVMSFRRKMNYESLSESEKLQADKLVQRLLRVELWLDSLPDDFTTQGSAEVDSQGEDTLAPPFGEPRASKRGSSEQ